MRYSDLSGKEIIDLDQGVRLGIVRDTDLILNAETGGIEAIVIPAGRGWNRNTLEIPWRGVKKIGVDLIIVDLSEVDLTPSALLPDAPKGAPSIGRRGRRRSVR